AIRSIPRGRFGIAGSLGGLGERLVDEDRHRHAPLLREAVQPPLPRLGAADGEQVFLAIVDINFFPGSAHARSPRRGTPPNSFIGRLSDPDPHRRKLSGHGKEPLILYQIRTIIKLSRMAGIREMKTGAAGAGNTPTPSGTPAQTRDS